MNQHIPHNKISHLLKCYNFPLNLILKVRFWQHKITGDFCLADCGLVSSGVTEWQFAANSEFCKGFSVTLQQEDSVCCHRPQRKTQCWLSLALQSKQASSHESCFHGTYSRDRQVYHKEKWLGSNGHWSSGRGISSEYSILAFPKQDNRLETWSEVCPSLERPYMNQSL